MSYTVRPITLADTILFQRWKALSSPLDLFGTPFSDINYTPYADEVSEWLKQFNQDGEQNNDRLAIIEDTNPDKTIGFLYLRNGDLTNMHCEISLWIGDQEHSKKEISSQVMNAMLYNLFNNLKMNKVYTRIAHNNTETINFYQQNRFIVEGIDRAAIKHNNLYIDIVQLSILQDEFMAPLHASRSE